MDTLLLLLGCGLLSLFGGFLQQFVHLLVVSVEDWLKSIQGANSVQPLPVDGIHVSVREEALSIAIARDAERLVEIFIPADESLPNIQNALGTTGEDTGNEIPCVDRSIYRIEWQKQYHHDPIQAGGLPSRPPSP